MSHSTHWMWRRMHYMGYTSTVSQQCLLPYHGAGVQWHSWWFNHLNNHQSLTKWEALWCNTLLLLWLISPLLCFCCFMFNHVLMRKLHVLLHVIFARDMTAFLDGKLFVLKKPLCSTKTHQPMTTTMEDCQGYPTQRRTYDEEKMLWSWDQPWTSKEGKMCVFWCFIHGLTLWLYHSCSTV